MRQFWRLTALPGARSYKATESEGLDDGCHALRMTIPDTYRNLSTVEGVRGESNPPTFGFTNRRAETSTLRTPCGFSDQDSNPKFPVRTGA